MKKRKAVLTVLLAVGMLAGCAGRGGNGELALDSSRIFVTGEGRFKTVMVEPFTDQDYSNQEYFSEEEMKSDIEQVISAYNAANGSGIGVDSCSIEKDSANLVLNYGTGEELAKFTAEFKDRANQVEALSIVPVSDVTAEIEAGGVRLLKSNGKEAELSKLKEKGEYRAVVVEAAGPVTIQTQERLEFVSDNVILKDRYTVQTTVGKSYIIFK